MRACAFACWGKVSSKHYTLDRFHTAPTRVKYNIYIFISRAMVSHPCLKHQIDDVSIDILQPLGDLTFFRCSYFQVPVPYLNNCYHRWIVGTDIWLPAIISSFYIGEGFGSLTFFSEMYNGFSTRVDLFNIM